MTYAAKNRVTFCSHAERVRLTINIEVFNEMTNDK